MEKGWGRLAEPVPYKGNNQAPGPSGCAVAVWLWWYYRFSGLYFPITKMTIWIHLVWQVVPSLTMWATGLGLYGDPHINSLVLQQMPPTNSSSLISQFATLNFCSLMKAWYSVFHLQSALTYQRGILLLSLQNPASGFSSQMTPLII